MRRTANVLVFALALAAWCCPRGHSQAALLLEEPYGFFGFLNPTGHNAIYFARICTDTPVKLRRCGPGESGSVIARYQGIDEYDWVAVPVIPYLYSVENASEVPARVNREQVKLMRETYRKAHLQSLGADLDTGNLVHGGWTQLLGVAYERRIYAFRFNTTQDQDDALIAEMNDQTNRSHFNLLYSNCADFGRKILNMYFPRTFRRSFFPDAGMTTPKQITYKLARYARRHSEEQLAIFEIPQVPGYRRRSHSNKSISESLTTTGYAVPIILINPYVAGGIFVDYLARGRFHLLLRNPQVIGPETLSALTSTPITLENPPSAGTSVPGPAAGVRAKPEATQSAESVLEGITATHE